jgi:hypothetical protein
MQTDHNFLIEEWGDSHPRYAEFINCLKTVAPEQAPFVEVAFSNLTQAISWLLCKITM